MKVFLTFLAVFSDIVCMVGGIIFLKAGYRWRGFRSSREMVCYAAVGISLLAVSIGGMLLLLNGM